MPNKIILLLIIGSAFLLNTSGVYCQLQERQEIDKIVAVVGDEIIMQSDINSTIAFLASQNPKVNPNDPQLRKQILDNLINNKLMVTKAIEDSVEVLDEEVNQYLDFWIQEEVRRYGSEKRLEDVYGISVARLRYEYKDEVRKKLLAQKLQQKKFSSISVSPREVEEFYKRFADSIPPIPEQVEIYHIVKDVEANKTAKVDTYELAKKVRDSILAGGDFADFAKRYSGDPGTKDNGGELGWFDKGKLYPDFEKSAFALQIGEVSLPVETPFGFHIIQTLEKKKDAVRTRHILFKIGQTTDDIEVAKKILADIKKRAQSGENFEELARQFSTDKETKGFGGLIGKVPVTEMPVDLIKQLPEGGISDPVLYKTEGGKTSYHIIYLKKRIPEHKATLADDYKQIEKFAIMEKQQKLFEEWVQSLRKELYWEIKQ